MNFTKKSFHLLLSFVVMLFFGLNNSISLYAQPQIIDDGASVDRTEAQTEGINLLNSYQQNEPENVNSSSQYQTDQGGNESFKGSNYNKSSNILMETYQKENPLDQLKSEIDYNNWENINDDHSYDSYSTDNIGGEGEDDGSEIPYQDESMFSNW